MLTLHISLLLLLCHYLCFSHVQRWVMVALSLNPVQEPIVWLVFCLKLILITIKWNSQFRSEPKQSSSLTWEPQIFQRHSALLANRPRLLSLKCLLKGASIYAPTLPLWGGKKLIITWFYMESRLSFDFDECSSCQTLHLTKSRTLCRGLSYVTKPLSGQYCDRRWHMKGIPPCGSPRTMEYGLEVKRVCMWTHTHTRHA